MDGMNFHFMQTLKTYTTLKMACQSGNRIGDFQFCVHYASENQCTLTKLAASMMPSSTGWVQSKVNFRTCFFFFPPLVTCFFYEKQSKTQDEINRDQCFRKKELDG